MVDKGTATAAGAIITTSITTNTWITNAPGRRLQEASEGRTQISCFGKCATSVKGTYLTALVTLTVQCAAVFCLFVTAPIVCC